MNVFSVISPKLLNRQFLDDLADRLPFGQNALTVLLAVGLSTVAFSGWLLYSQYNQGVLMQQGQAWEQQGKVALALRTYQSLVNQHPGYYPGLLALGKIYLQVDDPEKAALCFERAASLGKKRNNPQLAALAIAEYLVTQNYFEEAESALLGALPKVKKVTSPVAEKATKTSPENPKTAQKTTEKAEKAAKKVAIEEKPPEPSGLKEDWKAQVSQPMAIELRTGLAQLYEHWGDAINRSEDESDAAIEQAFTYYLKAAWVLKASNQTELQAVILPKLNLAGSQLLDRYELNNQANQNTALLQDWETLAPNAQLNMLLGQAYYQQQQLEKAYQQLYKAYKAKPNTTAPLLVKVLKAKQAQLDPKKDYAKIKAIEGSINTLEAQHSLKSNSALFPAKTLPTTKTVEKNPKSTPVTQN